MISPLTFPFQSKFNLYSVKIQEKHSPKKEKLTDKLLPISQLINFISYALTFSVFLFSNKTFPPSSTKTKARIKIGTIITH